MLKTIIFTAFLAIYVAVNPICANLGQAVDVIEEAHKGEVKDETKLDNHLTFIQYFNEDEITGVMFLDGVVVSEIFVHTDASPYEMSKIKSIADTYSKGWNPMILSDGTKAIKSDDGEVMIAYGAVAGTPFSHAITVASKKLRDYLKGLGDIKI